MGNHMGRGMNRSKNLWQQAKQSGLATLRLSIRSNHNRIVACGVLVCLVYSLAWVAMVGHLTLSGSSETLLNFGFIYLGVSALFRSRQQLAASKPAEDDRLLGYLLILSGSAIFAFFPHSISLQAVLCMVILVGIGLSTWGTMVFRSHLVSILLLIVSVYPHLVFAGNTIRRALTGHQLESWMAWLSSLMFQTFGQTASAQNQFLSLSTTFEPSKTVEVASGCSGFDMAIVLAGVGLILGLFFKQTGSKILWLMLIGVVLALAFNVPRIMVLAIAVAYWGQESFLFWHGPIGGQIFATVMLTCYYYAVMPLIITKPTKVKG